ncbi:glycosyltransferase family 2 protein [Alkalinema sp. FACHB-956]|nr:glycosyltransferase family 2 protein [Alkalinema sp. FACHB-956]
MPSVAQFLGWIFLGCAVGIIIPIGILFLECLTALLPDSLPEPVGSSILQGSRPSLDILIPAYNEGEGMIPTLQTIQAQLYPGDRLIVVADNCDDDTAAIARTQGAIVLERHDLLRRGKGYALNYGLQEMAKAPPEAVIIFDADCTVHPGTIDQLAYQTIAFHRPIQALYLLYPPHHPPKPKDAISAFAFTVKNWVRPQGLARLGLPCLLTGNGMAFPWAIIENAFLDRGNLVEDMQLAIDLAISGHLPKFTSQSKVTGFLPSDGRAAQSQRTRWEHGHLKTLQKQVWVLLKAALRQRRLEIAAIALDLSIPPLALLVMVWAGLLILSVLTGLLGNFWLPTVVLGTGGGLLMASILVAWYRFCRDMVSFRQLLAVPLYLVWKIPLYLQFLIRPQSEWIRTQRDSSDVAPSSHL